MRICQILAGNEDGGLEKHTIELSKQLKDNNVDITVIAHNDFKSFFQGVRFISLDLSKGRKNIFILYKLLKILQKEKFDIIHTQANKATSMIVRLKPFLNTKIISTLHSYKRDLSSFEKSDFVITVSNKISQKLKNKNKKTIYNGIDFKEIKDNDIFAKYNIPQDKFLICSVGRLCDVKRFDILIKSLKDLDVFCILAGDGEYKEKLIELAKNEGVSEKILFVGNVDNIDIKKIMKISKLFIITSDREGFPYVFVESLLSETPVLSTDVSDIKDIIGNEFIIPFNDYKALSNKVLKLKNNYELVLEKYNEIFIYAKKKFTLNNMVEETLTLYKEVLK
ncbi:glycosyltransferase family 4 protein [Poseidonibacter lekithochrous]|uniref:glycosyltransferase family 4 protein n=1 Tax=Poseidonibacter TaxID=2321187 RepID=UPI001C0867D3|nr:MULTISPECIES: glycosyltransferase family 4 protein [Poseidonibacter]MBU3015972.1 glycosyltransferase family 4 protein [Poseidonibacter lekithochrous]MDO6829271.1 glycosyltransferase family 4 protein [Poseidonibacter sp. 1_MG-2023]